ncbi:hypothetical protein N7499_006778 [Penicillium canescens]|nr:hypothetical protein N7499_006778 [Penicillium canescens]
MTQRAAILPGSVRLMPDEIKHFFNVAGSVIRPPDMFSQWLDTSHGLIVSNGGDLQGKLAAKLYISTCCMDAQNSAGLSATKQISKSVDGGEIADVQGALGESGRQRLPPESSNLTLQAAAYGGNEKMVLELLDRGADVNAGAENSGNVLQAASHRSRRRAVQILLERGADVHVEGRTYRNALYAASFLGHDKVVQVLEDKGAYVNSFGGVEENCTEGQYGTALQAASFRDHDRAVQMLLNKGADMNLPRKHGNTLCLASRAGHDRVVQMLVERGAR